MMMVALVEEWMDGCRIGVKEDGDLNPTGEVGNQNSGLIRFRRNG